MFNLAPVSVPDLSGKTVLVTGAGKGIGAHLAGLLVENGAEVFAGINSNDREIEKDLLSGARVMPLDVCSEAQVGAAMEQVAQRADKLDVLVNNAGIISPIGHFMDLETPTLTRAFEVNVGGVHRVTCAALELLKQSGGTIINAGTGAATTPMEGWTAYCCSKAGARMLTQMFALELKESGVKSFFIGIPPTDTDMQARIRAAGLNPISRIPQKDLVHPDVPASVMAWLCSDEAKKLDNPLLDVRDEFFTNMMDLS